MFYTFHPQAVQFFKEQQVKPLITNSILNSFKSFINQGFCNLKVLLPLTFKGNFILILSFILLYEFALKQRDFIALILALSFLSLLLILFVITIAQCIYLSINRAEISLHFDKTKLNILELNSFHIDINKVKLNPFNRIVSNISVFRLNDNKPCYNSIYQLDHLNQYTQSIYFTQRGNYSFKLTDLIITDILGLYNFRIHYNLTKNVIVYPNRKISKLKLDSLSRTINDSYNPSQFYFDGDYYEHRNYIPGDDTRRMNWKLTAKSGQLMVRMPEKVFAIQKKSFIFLSVSNPYDKDFTTKEMQQLLDNLIIECASFIYSQIQSGHIIYFASDFSDMPLKIYKNYNEILNHLSQIYWTNKNHFNQSFYQYITELKKQNIKPSECILFCPLISDWEKQLVDLSNNDIRVSLFAQRLSPSILKQLKITKPGTLFNWSRIIFKPSAADKSDKYININPLYSHLNKKKKKSYQLLEEQLLFKLSSKVNHPKWKIIKDFKILELNSNLD